MMQNNVTEVSRGGRSIYVGQKWGPACNYPEGSNTCLTLTYLGNDIYRVHVGFDFYIGRQAAQDILNAGSPIGANLVGEDDGPDQVRATIDLTYVQVGDGGLFAEFDTQVGSSRLNEDNGRD